MRRERGASREVQRAAPATWALAPVILALLAGCSGAPQGAPTSPTSAPSAAPVAAKNDVRARLQGTWQLVTFISLGPIPEEAAPVLAALHGAVHVRFEGNTVTTFLPGKGEEESCSFEISDESGDTFTLVTGTGMFRRAQARFVSNDLWEATENGPTWPGTTRFQRVQK